jgi:hypothetical protein
MNLMLGAKNKLYKPQIITLCAYCLTSNPTEGTNACKNKGI